LFPCDPAFAAQARPILDLYAGVWQGEPLTAEDCVQIEIYFSVVQRKVLTPGDFADLTTLEEALLGFQHRYETAAHPFEWTFTRQDLTALLARLALAGQRPAA